MIVNFFLVYPGLGLTKNLKTEKNFSARAGPGVGVRAPGENCSYIYKVACTDPCAYMSESE